MLVFVPAARLGEWWATVEPWLAAIALRSRGKFTLDELHEELADGSSQLWVWYRGELRALAVTQTVKFPGAFVCKIRICTGHDRHEWLAEGLAGIEAWAKSIGCDCVEPVARIGWQRDLKALGYRASHVEMSKVIRHAQP